MQAELIVRSGLMAKLADLASAGSVSAIRQFDKMLAAERVKATAGTIADRGRTPPKSAALGKKDAKRAAAKLLEGRFRTRTPPPALMN
ncbi:MAG: hypothetical protein Q8R81_09505 [Novosphingobium sp.]|uniref:hypothetical protein n=1 Tax=Novosphingobium sp. TaxID=1874826 RepID=UPI002732C46F|nr:hypothetical protein [Novosphingobium sp.]MDP3550620.1 hypothetical protein [Novosphingobium sp.]